MFILLSYLIGNSYLIINGSIVHCNPLSRFPFLRFGFVFLIFDSLCQLSKDLIHGTVKIGFSVLKSCHILGMRSGDRPWRIEFEYQGAATR